MGGLIGCWLDRNTDVDDDMTKLILERCKPIAPELLDEDGEFVVLGVQVGLRPSRRGGPRMEVEILEGGDGEGEGGGKAGKFVCHCYGHHSAGYVEVQLSCCEVRWLTCTCGAGMRDRWGLRMLRLIWCWVVLGLITGCESMLSIVLRFHVYILESLYSSSCQRELHNARNAYISAL